MEKNYDFQLPKELLTAAVVEEDEKIIAFGMLRTLSEAILICGGSKRDKILSLIYLINQCINDANDLGLSQVHIFVKDNSFAEILIHKFGFREEIGKTLVLELKDG